MYTDKWILQRAEITCGNTSSKRDAARCCGHWCIDWSFRLANLLSVVIVPHTNEQYIFFSSNFSSFSTNELLLKPAGQRGFKLELVELVVVRQLSPPQLLPQNYKGIYHTMGKHNSWVVCTVASQQEGLDLLAFLHRLLLHPMIGTLLGAPVCCTSLHLLVVAEPQSNVVNQCWLVHNGRSRLCEDRDYWCVHQALVKTKRLTCKHDIL